MVINLFIFLSCLTFCEAISGERRYLDQHMNDTACKHLNLSPKTGVKLNSAGVVELTIPYNNTGAESFVVTNWQDFLQSNIKNATACPPDSCQVQQTIGATNPTCGDRRVANLFDHYPAFDYGVTQNGNG